MKYILSALLCSQLMACSALNSNSDCDFGQVPAQYLQDNSGHDIDLDGNRVFEKVPNPYYQQYQRCQQQAGTAAPTTQRAATMATEQLHVFGQVFSLNKPKDGYDHGQRQYVRGFYTNPDNSAHIQYEMFTYPQQENFKQRFFKDINQTEGTFKLAYAQQQPYFIGKNNYGDFVVYVVKQMPKHVSIVQLTAKQAFKPQDLDAWVLDLYKL